ncbi:hypothetical protein PRIPAC_94740 [Pristionchus pacificus]|uniref:Xylulose kinase n=1 Tax=Pristionchus pacificus TaxID=54126 RepID=A0A2A6BJ94_PRIPA|nr:hypothetical protein PRIPAC_94740 [Pristionchus pacificus]|eukprot:PDM65896.1 hypothetical protein PRIPAC_44175 [Pristionchus pacificus]
MHRRLFLGLDLSTQQLKAVILDDSLTLIHTESLNFSKEFPRFGTIDGVIRDPSSPSRVFTPISLWLSSLDLLLHRLSLHSHFSLNDISAISGTAQQHGTVYWNMKGEIKLEGLSELSGKSLEEALQNSFSKEECPIWMDSSTTEFVDKFDREIPNLNGITGSRAYHRFSGMQIAKIFKYEREVYDSTSRISLISSFLASLFTGRIAPIDLSDGCGMNLLDMQSLDWSPLCLSLALDSQDDQLISDLRSKLGSPVPTSTNLGVISSYFVSRYNFSPNCQIISFTGDNLSSMADLNISCGDVILSLGTSDTAIYCSSSFSPLERGHVFIHPTNTHQFVYLICYKNGSLTRERIRQKCNLSWDTVSDALKTTPVGNNGNIGMYFDMDEIEPRVKAGDYKWNEKGERVESFSSSCEIRSVLESQCLHLRSNCPREINRVILTGGASHNTDIRQMIGDVFGRDVYTAPVADSAAQGGAKRARYVHNMPDVPYSAYFTPNLTLIARPIQENVEIYANLLSIYKEREASLLHSY